MAALHGTYRENMIEFKCGGNVLKVVNLPKLRIGIVLIDKGSRIIEVNNKLHVM